MSHGLVSRRRRTCLAAALAAAVTACGRAHAAATLAPWGGTAAPPLALKDIHGADHDLAHYRGKVVLVNFWATWCEPCRYEMPSMQRLKEKLAGRPFEVLAVNVDEPEARVRRFVTETRFDLPVLLDVGKRVTRGWSVRVMPTTFLVGPDGRIRYRVIGDLDWAGANVIDTIARLISGG